METLRIHVLTPLLGRVGTFLSAGLIPLGVGADLAHQAGIAISVLGLVGFDLAVGYFNRRHLANRVFSATVENFLNGGGQ